MTQALAPLGILGDGQLALMLGEAAERRGIHTIAFGESEDSSFARSFPTDIRLGLTELIEHLIQFAKQCSVITLENEFFSADVLAIIEKESGTRAIPDSSSYRHFESKLAQRRFYSALKIASPAWAPSEKSPERILSQIKNQFGFPVVLKASRGGYDGYGVRIVRDETQLANALTDLKHNSENPLLLEEKVAIQREFAQGALFDGKGGMILLPLVETVQRNGICELVLSRSDLPHAEFVLVKAKIASVLLSIAGSGIIGLYNFEFFYTATRKIFINEGAPRPHNSQHLGMDASIASQFDLLVAFLATGKLPDLKSPIEAEPAVMVNLLGKSSGENYALTLPDLPKELKVRPKLYRKKESRPGRKMGHLNIVDPSGTHDLQKIAERVLKEYQL